MRKHLRRLRKNPILKDEIIADAIFMAIPAVISYMTVFLFDIHHSFYKWPFEWSFIFTSFAPYLIFTVVGTLFGFFVIKVLLIGVKEEEEIWELKKKKK
jgi:lysylphosphatidylglycerol synthetase-like protein (DUF2156 family)